MTVLPLRSLCGLTESTGIGEPQHGPRYKGPHCTSCAQLDTAEKATRAGRTGKHMPRAKHVRLNLKHADPFVSNSQTRPTAHQSLFQRKVPGTGNQAAGVLSLTSCRGSASSDLPDSFRPEPEPAQERDLLLWLGPRESLPHRGQGELLIQAGHSLLLDASRVSCCRGPLPPSSLSPAAARSRG